MKRLYFGHPKGTYDTKFERMAIERIKRSFLFEDFPTLVNPNDPIHNAHAEGYRMSGRTESMSSMPYFMELVRSCDAGVFLLMPNGMWSYGTFLEAQELLKVKTPVWSIAFDGTFVLVEEIRKTRCMTREETTDWNKGLRAMNNWGVN